MGTTSINRKHFNPGIKHKLFQNFRRYKKGNSVSGKDSNLIITPVEQQFLQGDFICTKKIIDINKVLLKHLRNKTLYNKFDENSIIENPYLFFQEGLNLYFKDTAPDRNALFDSSQIIIFEENEKIFITPDDSYGHNVFVFELCMLDIIDYNEDLRKLMLYLFALVYKTNFFQDVSNTTEFDMIEDEFTPDLNEGENVDQWLEENEIDSEHYNDIVEEIKSYKEGNFRKLFNEMTKISCSKKHSSIIKEIKEIFSGIILDSDYKNELQNLLDIIFDNYSRLDWNDLKFLYGFQSKINSIIRDDHKYCDKHGEMIEYNVFMYDIDTGFINQYSDWVDTNMNEMFYQPYFIPTCFSEDGSEKDYEDTLDSAINIFQSVLDIEKLIYGKYRENIDR